jgi:hypothetical protein
VRPGGLLRSVDNGKTWVDLPIDRLYRRMNIYVLGPGPLERPSLYTDDGLL